MRIDEITLTETTEEDRALVSLSSYLHDYLINTSLPSGRITKLGKIGDIADTPVTALNGVRVAVYPGNRLSKLLGHSAVGAWDPGTNSIILNLDTVGTVKLKTTITHELRHALDDIKSDSRAGHSVGYNSPMPQHAQDAQLTRLAEPAEINARFSEVLHVLTRAILRAKKLQPHRVRDAVMDDLWVLLKNKRISELFPQKHKSRAYKRLIKRAVDFIDKEISHLASSDRQ